MSITFNYTSGTADVGPLPGTDDSDPWIYMTGNQSFGT